MNPSAVQHSFFAVPWSQYYLSKRKLHRPPPAALPARSPSPPAVVPDTGTSSAWIDNRVSSPSPSASCLSAAESSDSPPAASYGGRTRRHTEVLKIHGLLRPPPKPETLHTRHSAVITTILHRSLLESDFARARRAFGLLIRCKGIDIRHIWTIGLSLLSRADEFEKSVEFVRRLALFFPYRSRLHSHHPAIYTSSAMQEQSEGVTVAKSALDFYPALFDLQTAEADPRPQNIKDEIEELMLTPPWSDMLGLWLLLGMVLNWMADREEGERKEELRAAARQCFDTVRERGGEVPEEALWDDTMDESVEVDGEEDDSEDEPADYGSESDGEDG